MKIIYFVILLLFFLSCNHAERSEKGMQLSDSMTLDIPKNKKGELTELYKYLVYDRSVLGGLDSLESGFPTLELRIWFEYSDGVDRHLIVIKKLEHWIAECYTYAFQVKNDSVVVSKKNIWYPIPKTGWNKFIDSLKTLGILDLPDQSKIPGMFYHYNENNVQIEVAQKNFYRFYSYTAPRKHLEKFQEARKIEDIMTVIEAELGFRRLEPI